MNWLRFRLHMQYFECDSSTLDNGMGIRFGVGVLYKSILFSQPGHFLVASQLCKCYFQGYAKNGNSNRLFILEIFERINSYSQLLHVIWGGWHGIGRCKQCKHLREKFSDSRRTSRTFIALNASLLRPLSLVDHLFSQSSLLKSLCKWIAKLGSASHHLQPPVLRTVVVLPGRIAFNVRP